MSNQLYFTVGKFGFFALFSMFFLHITCLQKSGKVLFQFRQLLQSKSSDIHWPVLDQPFIYKVPGLLTKIIYVIRIAHQTKKNHIELHFFFRWQI